MLRNDRTLTIRGVCQYPVKKDSDATGSSSSSTVSDQEGGSFYNDSYSPR